VNVRPSTSEGRTWAVPTSHTTRAVITVVLPEPAPATTTPGRSGAVTISSCSSLNGTPSTSQRWSVSRSRTAGAAASDGSELTGLPRGAVGAVGGQQVGALGLGGAQGRELAVLAVAAGRAREFLV